MCALIVYAYLTTCSQLYFILIDSCIYIIESTVCIYVYHYRLEVKFDVSWSFFNF